MVTVEAKERKPSLARCAMEDEQSGDLCAIAQDESISAAGLCGRCIEMHTSDNSDLTRKQFRAAHPNVALHEVAKMAVGLDRNGSETFPLRRIRAQLHRENFALLNRQGVSPVEIEDDSFIRYFIVPVLHDLCQKLGRFHLISRSMFLLPRPTGDEGKAYCEYCRQHFTPSIMPPEQLFPGYQEYQKIAAQAVRQQTVLLCCQAIKAPPEERTQATRNARRFLGNHTILNADKQKLQASYREYQVHPEPFSLETPKYAQTSTVWLSFDSFCERMADKQAGEQVNRTIGKLDRMGERPRQLMETTTRTRLRRAQELIFGYWYSWEENFKDLQLDYLTPMT